MTGFWEWVRSSALVQALIALVLLCTICYMYLSTGTAPDELIKLFWAVLGFYFGSKVQSAIALKR